MSNEIFDLVRDGTRRAYHRAAFLKLVCAPPGRIDNDLEEDRQDQNPDGRVTQDASTVRPVWSRNT